MQLGDARFWRMSRVEGVSGAAGWRVFDGCLGSGACEG